MLNTLQEKHKQEILKELKIMFYRFHRYHNDYSIALFYTENHFDYEIVTKEKRFTDKLIRLEENLFVLVYENADISKSIGASSKLLSQLKKSYNESIYSVIEDCREDNEGSITLHNLFNLLDFSMKKNYDNEVVDKSYLDRIY